MGTNATTLRARNTKNANKPIMPIAACKIADTIISPPFPLSSHPKNKTQ